MLRRNLPVRVAVVGGGPAAAELLLALRALAEERVELELITPDSRLPLRGASTGAAFREATMAVYDLAELAEEVGARLRRDEVEAVASKARRLRLRSGGVTTYDALVVAVGARARTGVAGATTFRDHRDIGVMRAMLDDLSTAGGSRIVFAAPAGVAWTLPLYELALLTARHAAARGAEAEISIVTPERRALEVFGPAVSSRIESMLDEREIHFVPRTAGAGVTHGRLNLAGGGSLRADRVLAVPRLVGRRVSGLPTDWNAFVPTDAWGRVRGVPDVFAAGDVTANRIKQGGLATQQADVIASVIAAGAGAGPMPPAPRHVLRTRLLGAGEPLYLRAELDDTGRAVASSPEPLSAEPPWWPAAKLVGRHLSPWMARHAALQLVQK